MTVIESASCAALIIAFMFFNFGCLRNIPNDTALVSFYARFTTVHELMQELKNFEYKWEANDMNYYFDSAPEPILTVERRWANCNGFARLVSEFIKIKGAAYSLRTILMTQSTMGVVTRWHYINLILLPDGLYEQSNNQFRKLDNEKQAEFFWKFQGFETYEVVDTWQK